MFFQENVDIQAGIEGLLTLDDHKRESDEGENQVPNKRQRMAKEEGKENMLTCTSCKKIFARKDSLERHKKKGCAGVRVKKTCEQCGKKFSSVYNRQRHEKNKACKK